MTEQKKMNSAPDAPKILKESKNRIRVDFERTDRWTKFKIKYLSFNSIATFVVKVFRFLLLLGISYVILQPFFSKITSSFMAPENFVDATVKLIPKYPTLDTYKAVFTELGYFQAFVNTFTLSLLCAVIQTFICSLIGYGFAKFKFKGSRLLFALVIFTMIVPHSTLKLSLFLKFRFFDVFGILGLLGGDVFPRFSILDFSYIKLVDTYWPMVLLSLGGLAFKNGLYIFMMRQFFRGIPDELEESAYIDGSGVFRTFLTIILPISIPMMITIFLFAFSWQWTDNFYTNLFFPTETVRLMPDIVGIPKSLQTNYAGQSLYYAAINNTCGLVIIAPLIVLYLFCQRFLIQGVERSGIVG